MKSKMQTKKIIITSVAMSLMLIFTACSTGAVNITGNSNKSSYNAQVDETVKEAESVTSQETNTVTSKETDAATNQETNGPNEWRSSAEEFLSGYLSLLRGIDWVEGSQNQDALVKFAPAPSDLGGLLYYDSAGNVINEAPFLIGEAPYQMVAMEYFIYDLDNSGIPAISIYYAIPESSGDFPTHIYKYINGEYRLVGNVAAPQFNADSTGQILVFESSWFGERELRVSRLMPGDLGVEMIFDWGQFSWEDIYERNPNLFDKFNEPLTPIEPLLQLQIDIFDSITKIFESMP